MLIIIDDSVMNNFEDKDLDAITYLFSSSSSAYHIVHAHIDVLESLLSKDIGGMAKRQIENIKKKYISFKALIPNIVHRIVVYKKESMIKDDEQVAFSNQIGKMLPNYIKNHGTIFIVWWLTLDVA